ncbi:MAG: Gfo/Idh/MocA family oxidoreductase [Bacteroidota bacterium]
MKRRDFLKTSALAGASLTMARQAPAVLAASPNETVRVAVMGVNSRGDALAQSVAKTPGAEVVTVCDVDERTIGRCIDHVVEIQERAPKGVRDLRRVLDDPDVDALVIAAPDHWHAPAAILAMKAGKHVYLEKPGSHNPREGEWLTEAQQRYGRLVQMGNQQRSAPRSIEIIQRIREENLIGQVYYAKCWYANTRGSIGRGQPAAVPDWLDYELWQGPAPRRPYQDNLIHYNWHWFWHWGTGEINNNAAHELDICRWALGVDYPTRVTSTGGRYHYDDDWECTDTQTAGFEFEGNKNIVWEGRSCSGFPVMERGRGSRIHGTEGTVVIDRGGYAVYDRRNQLIEASFRNQTDAGLDTRGGGPLTDIHLVNFFDAIRTGASLRSPIAEGQKSVLLCHLGNIAQRTTGALDLDPTNGHILGHDDAMALWSRTYEPGWAPTVD